MTKLHPDFPDRLTVTTVTHWDRPAPYGDIEAAFNAQYDAKERFRFEQVATVEQYFITSNEGDWKPGGEIGTELEMVLLGRLVDGRWFGLEAGNDYTGWGCQDNCDVYAGPTREDVVRNGITQAGRAALGLTLDA